MRAREIATHLLGRLVGEDNECRRLAPLYCAQADELSVLLWPKDIALAKKKPCGALICSLEWAAEYASDLQSPLIVIEDFFEAFTALSSIFRPTNFAARIGAETIIGQGAVIEEGVIIGAHCQIGVKAVIHRGSVIGDRVRIGAGSVIGAEAFAPYGLEKVCNLPSLGSVLIENDVRLGAVCTVDRGLIGRTTIKNNTLMDNMVHIGHDSLVGENVVIAAQSALAGFVQLENEVTLGGQVGVAPHAVLKQGCRISAKSLVRGVIGAYELWSGNPSVPHKMYLKEHKERFKKYRGQHGSNRL